MKRRITTMALIIVLLFSVAMTACANGAQSTETKVNGTQEDVSLAKPEGMTEKFSYAFGYMFTQSYVSEGIEFDPEYFALAMKEASEGKEGFFTSEEMNTILMEYQSELMAKQQAAQEELAAANLAEAESFLETNKGREGVIETASGLQYEVVTEGDGPRPTAEDVVTVHYTGSFLNGMVFESSKESGSPATFALGGVIPGWVEGVQLMSVGSSYRFYLHPDLAYGPNGSDPVIGPNQLLIFEVDLLGIEEDSQE